MERNRGEDLIAAAGKKRLDRLLVECGLMFDLEKARRGIRAGMVTVNGQPANKPGQTVAADAAIEIIQPPPYVSRGGEKLKGALEDFQLSVQDLVILDLGSSTGGFTDCLLQEGGRRVFCLDVGRGQLAWKLRQDPRVTVKEGFNARYLTLDDLPEKPELITLDLSFISLCKVLPAAVGVMRTPGLILALIKPQFEADRREVQRGGVVRDESVHRRVISEIEDFATNLGLKSLGVKVSRLTGPAGNREFFILLSRQS